MKQEFAVPKLRLPGQANWLMRTVAILGAIVVAWLGVLGYTYWRRGSIAPAPVAQVPAAPPAPASVPAAPAAPAPVAPKTPGRPANPIVPAAPAAASTLAGKTIPGKLGSRSRMQGGRFVRSRAAKARYAKWKKGRYAKRGKAYPGGRRAWLARKAYLRKKRLAAARGAAPPVATAKLGARAASSPRTASKAGDPIDEILRNFK